MNVHQPDYSEQVTELHRPCAAKWPADPEFKAGYDDTTYSLARLAQLSTTKTQLADGVEDVLRHGVERYPCNERQRGVIEALLWYWEKVLEQDDTAITIVAKSLLYPEPVMGY